MRSRVSFGLDRVRLALERLGNPQRAWRSVQIAGTNGKGSTAAMTESILRTAGLRTGLFTSPHLCRFEERFRIGRQEVTPDELATLFTDVRAAVERRPLSGGPPTFFELATKWPLLGKLNLEYTGKAIPAPTPSDHDVWKQELTLALKTAVTEMSAADLNPITINDRIRCRNTWLNYQHEDS